MNFRHKRREDPEVNITPLIDIVFLLLIFFMVSTTFKQDFEVGIALPEASSETKLVDKTLEVTIDQQGRYFINGKQLINSQAITVKRALEKLSDGKRNMPVVISADAKAAHQSVIIALDAARQLGFSRVTFATQQLTE